MTDTFVTMQNTDGKAVRVKAVDNGDGTFSLATTATVSINNLTLGAVKILDEVGVNEAIVDLPANIDASKTVLGVYAVGNSQILNPADQISAAAYADFAGSTLDARHNTHIGFTLLNLDGANAATWQILAANLADFSDAFVQQAGASILAGAVGHVEITGSGFRFYKVQIKDTVGGAHANCQLAIVGKD